MRHIGRSTAVMIAAVPQLIRVLLPLPLPAFSYVAPHDEPPPVRGARVVVPWQQGLRIGIVTSVEEDTGTAGIELREAITTLDTRPFISSQAVSVVERAAQAACSAEGLVLATLLRTGLNEPILHEVKLIESSDEAPLPVGQWVRGEDVEVKVLEHCRRQGLILERARVLSPTVRVLKPARQVDDALAGARKANQRVALEYLWELGAAESAAELARSAEVPASAVKALLDKGYAAYEEVEAPPPPLPSFVGEPVQASESCLPDGDALIAGGLRRDRLAAIFGRLKQDVERGGSVLIVVPEQAILAETASALGGSLPVQVFSGELSDLQRQRAWHELTTGGPVVLVATYMGILAPVANLARVVVLEAGATSHKLTAGARIFIPTAARLLAREHNVPFVASDVLEPPEQVVATAGSSAAVSDASKGATPGSGVAAPAADAKVADLNAAAPAGPKAAAPSPAKLRLAAPRVRLHVSDLAKMRTWPLGTELNLVLKQVAERQRQAVLIAPRRGFSAALRCRDCRLHIMCPNCDLPLRYYKERQELRCHQCGHDQAPPERCPSCKGVGLAPTRAAGTEWIAREVTRLLPKVAVMRWDADKRDDLSDLKEGKPGVVVGTTAILRHPPLPNVSLVGLTMFDAFVMDDFRAEEEALRLLLNLSELAPGSRTLTVVQTFQPEHPLLAVYRNGVSEAFIEEMLARRRRFDYPPYSELAKIQVTARKLGDASDTASWLADAIATAGATPGELLGPAPAPVLRTRNEYTYQLFVKVDELARLREVLQPALNYRGRAKVRIDVDPRDLSGFIE